MRKLRLLILIGISGLLMLSCADAARVSVVGKLTRSFDVAAGDVREGQIDLRCNSEDASTVRVYQSDYTFQADGSNAYGEPGTLERSNEAWISFSPSEVTLQPGQTDVIHFEMRVPDDHGLRGSYWSMIMVEAVPAPKPLADDEDDRPKITLNTVFRYGIQIVANLTGGEASLQFVRRELVAREDGLQLQIDAANNGEIWLNLSMWAELFDAQGRTLGRFTGNRQRIYPGCSAAFHIDLGKQEAGQYQSLVVADNGDENVFGAQYDLQVN